MLHGVGLGRNGIEGHMAPQELGSGRQVGHIWPSDEADGVVVQEESLALSREAGDKNMGVWSREESQWQKAGRGRQGCVSVIYPLIPTSVSPWPSMCMSPLPACVP